MDAHDKAAVFIDGNNFYNSFTDAKRGAGFASADYNHKLDFIALARKLVRPRRLAEVRYYVAQLKNEGDTSLYSGQQRFISRLSRDGVVFRMGRMEKKPSRDKTAAALESWLSSPAGLELPPASRAQLRKICGRSRENPIWKEKAVDTTLVTDLISMAFNGEYDAAYIVSFDGDYTPAAEKVRETGKRVFAASPRYGAKLDASVDRFITLHREFFADLWRDS